METISFLLNLILGSGLIATLATLRYTRKKSKEEAKSAEIDNNRKLLDNFDTFIVKPLKSEVNELRKTVNNLHLAIKQIPACPHADTCPVSSKLNELHDSEENHEIQRSQSQPENPNAL